MDLNTSVIGKKANNTERVGSSTTRDNLKKEYGTKASSFDGLADISFSFSDSYTKLIQKLLSLIM